MFLAALDAIFTDLKKLVPLEKVVVINTSGQQHGHVYLNNAALNIFASLDNTGNEATNLVYLLKNSLAYDHAPIWMTADTGKQASFIRDKVGGKEFIDCGQVPHPDVIPTSGNRLVFLY